MGVQFSPRRPIKNNKRNNMGNYKKYRPEKAISNSEFRNAGVEWILTEDNTIIGAKQGDKKFDRKWVDDLFYKLGIDTKYAVLTLTDVVGHRNSKNKFVIDHRILGYERIDKDWIKSGNASEDAYFASSSMRDMVSFVHKLANGGHND